MRLKKIALFGAAVGLFGCLSKDAPDAPKGNAGVGGSISFHIAIAADSPFKSLAKTAELDISAPDMSTIRHGLQINDSSVEGKVDNIPAGPNRNFLVKVFDSAGSECYRGSAIGNIHGDSTALITVRISRIDGSAIINGTIDEGGEKPAGPFAQDDNTVFLADFNDNLKDRVSGDTGTLVGGTFTEALFGKGIQFQSAQFPKALFRFPNSTRISVTTGSIEALVKADAKSSGFMHIVDKSWLYGLTVYDGVVAVDFGTTWWYSGYTMPLQKWVYLCGSYDGKTIRLYANGVLVDSSPYIATAGDVKWGLGIGNADDDGFNIPFLGKIDEIRISKKARADSEIADAWKTIGRRLPP